MKRRRIVVVLLVAAALYMAAWFVTARVGAPSVRQSLLSSGVSTTLQDVSDLNVEPEDAFAAWYYVRASSPFPFIVSVRMGFSAPQMLRVRVKSTYIWCFGMIRLIRQDQYENSLSKESRNDWAPEVRREAELALGVRTSHTRRRPVGRA
jgi:hypothetical protein